MVWELESGYNSASIGNTADLNKGLLTATDVGVARVVAHPTNDLTTAASLEIPIYAISDITLRVAGQVEPQDITVPRGTDVHFEAIGIFDDNDGDAEDLLELNISTCASWAVGRPIVSAGPPVVYEDGAFALEFFYGAAPALDRGILHTNDPNLQAGFRGFVSVCFPPDSFPPGEVEPTIGGGFRAFSNMITVTLE